ncbi:heme transporter HRG1 isoform X2 [Myotis lucifugus]|uniref:heme transporter HRG1 isoform X2 n=1 Tax=Myotis lucifugus TaxID=59463 RepID=UPI000CCBF922|nr:heme transporter HRG1 isoform X2 [Myotis lucifugus]
MAPSRRQLGLRAAYSGLSSVAGFSIFIVWTVVYSQPWTAAMGGLAEINGENVFSLPVSFWTARTDAKRTPGPHFSLPCVIFSISSGSRRQEARRLESWEGASGGHTEALLWHKESFLEDNW